MDVTRKLKPNTDRGDVFQTLMLGRHESQEIKHSYHREIEENTCDHGCPWRGDERNHKTTPTSPDQDVTDRRCHHSRRDTRHKRVGNRLVLGFQDEWTMFQDEPKSDEFNQAEKSIHRRSPTAQASVSNMDGGDFLQTLALTQAQSTHREGPHTCHQCGKTPSGICFLTL